jgi:hypothetical protein
MTDLNQPANTANWLEEPKKLPSLLNVLTILTFIGSGLGFIFSIVGYFNAASNYDKVVQAQDKMDQLPTFFKNMMGPDPVGAARLALDNKLPILLISLVSCSLCLYGAIQMRKLKKTGFSIYVIGDVVSFATAIFMGLGMLTGFSGLFGIAIAIIFVILYATQLKYMSK